VASLSVSLTAVPLFPTSGAAQMLASMRRGARKRVFQGQYRDCSSYFSRRPAGRVQPVLLRAEAAGLRSLRGLHEQRNTQQTEGMSGEQDGPGAEQLRGIPPRQKGVAPPAARHVERAEQRKEHRESQDGRQCRSAYWAFFGRPSMRLRPCRPPASVARALAEV